MKFKFLTFLVFSLLFLSLISASCTISLDKDSYAGGETATATLVCSLGSEKNTAYTVIWNNGTAVVETDTGTTPNVVSQAFFETLEIPTGQNWANANVSLNLSASIEDFDTFIVNSTASSSSLVVKNITFTSASELFLGKTFGVRAIIEDENGKKISNANCEFDIEDGTSLPITSATDQSHGGISQTEFILDSDTFDEARQYIARVSCFCGSSGTANACIDEDGNEINNSVGSATNTFTMLSWLTVNTVTSVNGSINPNEEFSICANVTNNLANNRVDLKIYYNWRCGSGSDSDTDRIVYGGFTQIRGISANATQMQCHDFIVPNEEHMEKGANKCYGATDVSVLDEESDSIVTYPTTSSQFNVTVSSIHPNVNYERISKNIYFANVSFNDFDSGVKDVHVILDGDLNGGDTSLTSITNYTVTYFNGTTVPYVTRIFFHKHAIRFQENIFRDDAIEIEVANVNTTLDENFNLTIIFENYAERQTEALEGIENKTGTFHLDVNCPSSIVAGSDMGCVITAYVEDSQVVEKEVDFTCYITDGVSQYSSTNFNQMITRNSVSINRTFSIPSTFENGQEYILQCYADYYNLGSRRDSFYDTFVIGAASSGGSSSGLPASSPKNDSASPITGGAIDEEGGKEAEGISEIINEFNPFSPSRNWVLISALWIFIAGIFLIIFLLIKKRKKHNHYHNRKNINWKNILQNIGKVLLGIIVLVAIGFLIFYGYSFLKNLFSPSENLNVQAVETSQIILQGNLAHSILLIGFAILIISIIVLLFIFLLIILIVRVLGIKGEFRIGGYVNYHDRKLTHLQNKINRETLKRELKHLKK